MVYNSNQVTILKRIDDDSCTNNKHRILELDLFNECRLYKFMFFFSNVVKRS